MIVGGESGVLSFCLSHPPATTVAGGSTCLLAIHLQQILSYSKDKHTGRRFNNSICKRLDISNFAESIFPTYYLLQQMEQNAGVGRFHGHTFYFYADNDELHLGPRQQDFYL